MFEQEISLDVTPGGVPPVIYASQDDNGRAVRINLSNRCGSVGQLSSSYTYSLRGTKPSGTGFAYDDAITVSGLNSLSFKTTSAMTAVEGPVRCSIIIYDGDEHIETLNFILMVQRAALSSEDITDASDFDQIIKRAVAEYIEESGLIIDDQLETPGAAADAKVTGDEIRELKSALDDSGLTDEAKEALLDCFAHVAWIDEHGQDYYDALEEALYNTTLAVTNNLTNCTTSNEAMSVTKGGSYSATITASTGYVMTGATVSITMGGNDITATAYSNSVISIPAVTGVLVITISAAAKTVSSISAVYTQSGTVYTTDSLASLKPDLVVTATYDDSSTAVISADDYTLSGMLTEGTSTITVTYSGKTTTFTVIVSADEYVSYSYELGGISTDGSETEVVNRLRTDFIPVTAGTTYVFITPPLNYIVRLYDSNKDFTGSSPASGWSTNRKFTPSADGFIRFLFRESTDAVLDGDEIEGTIVGTASDWFVFGNTTITNLTVYNGKGVSGTSVMVDNPNRALTDEVSSTDYMAYHAWYPLSSIDASIAVKAIDANGDCISSYAPKYTVDTGPTAGTNGPKANSVWHAQTSTSGGAGIRYLFSKASDISSPLPRTPDGYVIRANVVYRLAEGTT